MRTWTVTESGVTALPNFDIRFLPDRAFQYLTPQLVHTNAGTVVVKIESGPFIGTIPLLNGDVLRIVPQAGEKSLWRMLLVSEGLAQHVNREFDDFTLLGYDDAGSNSWLNLLARTFFDRLRIIEKNSLKFERVLVSKNTSTVRGKIEVLPTLLALHRRELQPIHGTFKERTFETLEHIILGTAALRLLQAGVVDESDLNTCHRWVSRASVRLKATDLEKVLARLRTRRYAGPRSYYIPALLMARLLLAEAGISLEQDGAVSSEVMLTNIRTLYERYILAVIRDSLKTDGYIVEKREDSPRPLFEDGTCNLIPDVIVADVSGVKLILDAKYKIDKAVAEADYYQMAAYLSTYGISTGALVIPSLRLSEGALVTRRTQTGLTIHEVRLPIDNWASTEAFLAEVVQRFLSE